ncbi:hypothetical protein T05_5607 [Trichinella murrelli]|uniref:Uncharacterized protein n=1 Tax=Trichinella murrelli TaxID=144512 RepID=A0A0V0TXJ1_9BILA|nr:hypothetical protein T05_5607 [Trichinella murrelli]
MTTAQSRHRQSDISTQNRQKNQLIARHENKHRSRCSLSERRLNPDYQARATGLSRYYIPSLFAKQPPMLREWTVGMDVSGISSSSECRPGKTKCSG